MSHYFGAVVVPIGTERADVEPYVDKAMAPHQESYDEASDTGTGFWDWWQIGGRWTGVWGEYDPAKDPANVETCRLCAGSGKRKDMVVANGCNGCQGEGVSVTWPTQWRPYDGDVIKVAALLNNPLSRPFTIVLPDGTAAQRETWNGNDFVEDPDWDATLERLLEPYRDQAIVVVDYHS